MKGIGIAGVRKLKAMDWSRKHLAKKQLRRGGKLLVDNEDSEDVKDGPSNMSALREAAVMAVIGTINSVRTNCVAENEELVNLFRGECEHSGSSVEIVLSSLGTVEGMQYVLSRLQQEIPNVNFHEICRAISFVRGETWTAEETSSAELSQQFYLDLWQDETPPPLPRFVNNGTIISLGDAPEENLRVIGQATSGEWVDRHFLTAEELIEQYNNGGSKKTSKKTRNIPTLVPGTRASKNEIDPLDMDISSGAPVPKLAFCRD